MAGDMLARALASEAGQGPGGGANAMASSAARTGPSGQAAVRERILTAAGFLFYQHGYRAVGIDRIIAEAGVAKATFYKSFGSKDALIVSWIERSAATLMATAPAEDRARPLTEWALSAIRRAGRDWAMGCGFQTAAAEFSDTHHPVQAEAAEVKRRSLAGLVSRAEAEGLGPAEAEGVYLLVEGVLASVRMFGPRAPLAHAPAAICRLTGAPLA